MYSAEIEKEERRNFEHWLCRSVNALLEDRPVIRLLEAGCGSATHIRFTNQVEAVGIDISEEQLQKNTFVQTKIHGDIQTYVFPSNEFDVAICWDVLEHLQRPSDAVARICSAIKVGGIIILGFPNVLSMKGMVTKYTPFWFHELFCEAVLTSNDKSPFPTVLPFSMRPSNIRRTALMNRFEVLHYVVCEGFIQKRITRRFGVVYALCRAVHGVMQVLSLGRFRFLSDYCIVIARKAE